MDEKRLEENYDIIRKYLVTLHDDGDDDSLYVRFAEMINHYRDKQMSYDAFMETMNRINNDNSRKS